MLQPHTIKPAVGSKHRVKKVGCGNASGHGTSSGRGGKGQTARSGGSRGLKRLGFKFLLQSTPKLKGFKSIHKKPSEVYLHTLEKNFNDGEVVSVESLKEKRLIPSSSEHAKILNSGTLSKKIVVSGVLSSKGAAEKIRSVGGEVK
jgi:large subunit ribosomal protein L15